MKTVILCGGLRTRLAEETHLRPKPMVEVGGMPILWHIMKTYAHYGYNDFVLALGYKGEVIKDYFLNYYSRTSNVSIHLKTGETEFIDSQADDWKVSMYDTGLDTLTGGRLARLSRYLKSDSTFMLTYGDGVANIDINALINFHRSHGKLATITAVRPPARFGAIQLFENHVMSFQEKPQTGEGWINGGFFVFEPGIFDYLDGDQTILEREPLEKLCADRQ